MSKLQDNIFAAERKQMILDLVNGNIKTTVSELCEEFSVSPATIRNDLRELENARLLKRTHGGAVSNRKVSYELNTYQKEVQNITEKRAMAKLARKYVQEGDSISLDTGTTTFELAKLLVDLNNITVVTYDLQIASYLESHSNVTIIMAGGIVRHNFHSAIGETAIKTFEQFNVDKVFLATNALSFHRGLSTPSIETAQVKKAMIKMADEVILLADSSKMYKSSLVRFACFEDIDIIITDDKVNKDFIKKSQEKGLKIELASYDE